MPISDLVDRASTGDKDAWRELVDRHTPVVWAVIRAHRLRGADAADVMQHTWVALTENLTRLRRPDRLPAWLATTARRECLRVLGRGRREVPLEDVEPMVTPAFHSDGEQQLWDALSRMPRRCRELLGLLVHAPELTYVQVSRALGIKVASLSGTRGRCIDQLRRKLVAMGGDPTWTS
jgi:RNA polymerase sigma factor (sigma-70 family)